MSSKVPVVLYVKFCVTSTNSVYNCLQFIGPIFGQFLILNNLIYKSKKTYSTFTFLHEKREKSMKFTVFTNIIFFSFFSQITVFFSVRVVTISPHQFGYSCSEEPIMLFYVILTHKHMGFCN